MKRSVKVFEMNEHELRSALNTLDPHTTHITTTKSKLQEELVNWMLVHNVPVTHHFLFHEDNQGILWLLNPNNKEESIEDSVIVNKPNTTGTSDQEKKASQIAPFEVVVYRPTPKNSIRETNKPNSYVEGSKVNDKSSQPPKRGNSSGKNNRIHPNVITEQPLPGGGAKAGVKPTTKSQDKDQEKQGCCRLCCYELGLCCTGLMSNI